MYEIDIPFNLLQASKRHSQCHWISGELPLHSAVVFKDHWSWSIQFIWWLKHASKWQIFKNIEHFNCGLDFNLTNLLIVRVLSYSPMLWRWGFSNDCLTTLMLKVSPNMLLENIKFKQPWTFLEAVLFTLLLCCVLPFYRSELYCSSQNWRQDPFQKWKLYWQTPACLISISGLIRILMRVIRLTNVKPCRCY